MHEGGSNYQEAQKGGGNIAKGEVRKEMNGIPIELWQTVYRRFEIFLEARGFTRLAKNNELLKINKYVHNACSYSRKKLRKNETQRNSENEEEGE